MHSCHMAKLCLDLILTCRFLLAGLSMAHFCADQLLDWSLAAKWARLLITSTYPTHRSFKHGEIRPTISFGQNEASPYQSRPHHKRIRVKIYDLLLERSIKLNVFMLRCFNYPLLFFETEVILKQTTLRCHDYQQNQHQTEVTFA